MSNPAEGSSGSARVFDGVYNETDGYTPSLECVQAHEGAAITKLLEPLEETNWMGWQQRMKRVLRLCGIFPRDTKSAKTGNSMTIMLK